MSKELTHDLAKIYNAKTIENEKVARGTKI